MDADRFGRAITQLGRKLEDVSPDVLRTAARHADDTLYASIRRATGGDGRLSHAGGKAGRTIRTKTVVTDSGLTIRIHAVGPLQLVDNPTKAHDIGPKVKGRSKGKRRTAVSSPWGPRAVVYHPGTKGKHSWQAGEHAAKPQAERELSASYRRVANALN